MPSFHLLQRESTVSPEILECHSKGSLIMSRRSRKFVFLVTFFLVFCLSVLAARVERFYGQDSAGALQPFWSVTHGGSRADEGWGVAVDAEHNVYFAGFDRIAAATANVFLRKLTPDGVSLWNASWQQDIRGQQTADPNREGCFENKGSLCKVQAHEVHEELLVSSSIRYEGCLCQRDNGSGLG